jgi:hypothetical protein
VDPEHLDNLLGSFTRSAFRLETRQQYAVGGEEAERLAAFRARRPRPERSVATSGYLRHVARAVLEGKDWARVHVVDVPLSEYLRYQFIGYQESAAAGERVYITERGTAPDLATLCEDFWYFDEGLPTEQAVLLGYTDHGEFTGAHLAGPAELPRLRAAKAAALRHAVPLNAYLAGMRNRRAA